jgi:hypothetical protein
MMRLMPQEASDRATEYPMADTWNIAPELGVSEIAVEYEFPSDHYVDFLGAKPGDTLEFFAIDGTVAAAPGVVKEVIKAERKDNLILEDGRELKFRGRGPQPPIAVVRVVSSLNRAAEAVAADAVSAEEAAAAAARRVAEEAMMALLERTAPADVEEDLPIARQAFSDSLQRQELFEDLLGDLKEKQKRNPRRLRELNREVDVAMALKNVVVRRNAAGIPTATIAKPVETVADAVEQNPGGVSAAIPVVDARRVLHLDADKPAVPFRSDQVEARMFEAEEISEARALASYEAAGSTIRMDGYLNDLLDNGRDVLAPVGPAGAGWADAQDVIRTAGLGSIVAGLGKGLPPYDPTAVLGDTNPTAITQENIVPDVVDRAVRVLPATMRFRPYEEPTVIVPSDPSTVLGYVMLPAKAALSLRPPTQPGDLPTALLYSAALQSSNLPTIARTLRDLYAGAESADALHAWMMPVEGTQDSVAGWLGAMFKYAVHPSEALGPRSPAVLSLLDTVGLGKTEMAPAIANEVWAYLGRCQKTWRRLVQARRQEIQKGLSTAPPRTFQSVATMESPLWAALRSEAALADIIGDVDRRNPTIGEAPLVVVAALESEAQGDAAPLAWNTIAKLDARPPVVDGVAAADALAASRSYALRRKAIRDFALLSMHAEPEINPCPHVPQLEAVRNTRDQLQRARLLDEFIQEFQGPRQGDWTTCAVCAKECICEHEKMEIRAIAQPALADRIQKDMLVRFGGQRYEGKISCRNCGQGLQVIDFDDRPEFDDEGNVVSGFSVVEPEPEQEGILGTPAIVYPTQDQQFLGDALRILFERAGFVENRVAMLKIVQLTDYYVAATLPGNRDDYEKRRAAMLQKASTVITKSGAAPSLPPYDVLVNRNRIAGLTALTVLALQAMKPPIVVQTPFPLCKFSREGWPLRTEAKPDDVGALSFMSCVLASIARDSHPWADQPWVADPKIEARQKKTYGAIFTALNIILGTTKPPLAIPFRADIMAMLDEKRKEGDGVVEKVSLLDELPVGFRPEPFPAAAGMPALERDPVPTVRAALEGGTPAEDLVEPIAAALRAQTSAVLTGLNTAAAAGIAALPEKPALVNDTVCCPTPLREVEARALLGAPEQKPLVAARELLRGSIPTVPNAGTHLWPITPIPIPEPVESAVDEGVLFKLFLKYCYVGPQVGRAHEFSVGNTCRQCGLALGKPLDLVDFGAEGATILAGQQGPLKVETTVAAFESLSAAVRRQRILLPTSAPVVPGWRGVLEGLTRMMRERKGMREDQGMRSVAVRLEDVLKAIDPADPPMEEVARATVWAPLAAYMDQLRAEVANAIGPIVPAAGASARAEARAREATRAFAAFDTLTEEPFLEGPKAVQEYWCARTENAGHNVVRGPEAGSSRWFNIGQSHANTIQELIEENYRWYGGAALPELAQKPLLTVAGSLGPLMRLWVREMRAPVRQDGAWTVEEARMILRTCVLQAWRDVLVGDSWVYAAAAGDSARRTATMALADWTRALMLHARQQAVRYTNEEVRRTLQNIAELERTSVVREFKDLDDDERAGSLLLKQFRIGRWAIGKNLQTLDADRFEFERMQRERMGITESAVAPIALAGAQEAPAALVAIAGEAYNMNQDAAGDDY